MNKKILEAAHEWPLNNYIKQCEWSNIMVTAFLAGARLGVEMSAEVAEKHSKNFEAGVGKWSSNDIADQIIQLLTDDAGDNIRGEV